MEVKLFTEEEIEILRANSYVVEVNARFVYFSASFKERFYQEYKSGKKPKRIFADMGIDTRILGASRVSGIKNKILKTAQEGKSFSDISSFLGDLKYREDMTPEARIRRLEHELAYTKQELEFVKKIIASGQEEKA